MAPADGENSKESLELRTIMAGLAMRKSTGSKHTASVASVGRSNGGLSRKRGYPLFAICVDNHGYELSLLVGKVYQVVKPQANDAPYDLRIIDEEAEDYLYPAERFVPLDLPAKARKAVMARS